MLLFLSAEVSTRHCTRVYQPQGAGSPVLAQRDLHSSVAAARAFAVVAEPDVYSFCKSPMLAIFTDLSLTSPPEQLRGSAAAAGLAAAAGAAAAIVPAVR